MLSEILLDAQALISSFSQFIYFEQSLDLPFLEACQDCQASISSRSGLVTLHLSAAKVSIFARSNGPLTSRGTKFREPMLLLLKHYFPEWAKAEDWLVDFLESDRRLEGLSTENRAIMFRKSELGIFVDVEQRERVFA